MMSEMTATLSILEPYPGIFAYYDGRVRGKRLHAEGPNWLDDGAYSLGVASYAIVNSGEAVVYDTHISLAHASTIRAHLESLGCPHNPRRAQPLAQGPCCRKRRLCRLRDHRPCFDGAEAGGEPRQDRGWPTRRLRRWSCRRGCLRKHWNSLSAAAASNCIISRFTARTATSSGYPTKKCCSPGTRWEDTVTYIAEPGQISTHIAELRRMREWPIKKNSSEPRRQGADCRRRICAGAD